MFHKPRKNFTRLSGGIAIGFKHHLVPYVKIVKTDCEYVMWAIIDKSFLHTDENLILGVCYVSPENSNYSSISAFDEIEADIIENFSNNRNIILLGDFNAKTKQTNDLDLDNTGIPEITNQGNIFYPIDTHDKNNTILKNLHNNELKVNRNSEDKNNMNNFGHKLINMCQTCSFIILNGRSPLDQTGKTTCHDKSVVDYALVSLDMLETFSPCFSVSDFSPLLSDVHCPIIVSLTYGKSRHMPNVQIQNINTCNQHTNRMPSDTKPDKNAETLPRRWTEEKSNKYCGNIDPYSVSKINDLANNLRAQDSPDTGPKGTDALLGLLESTFLNAAKLTFGTRTGTSSNPHSQCGMEQVNTNEWFNEKCRLDRKAYHHAKKTFNKTKSPNDYYQLQQISKRYKRTQNKAINNYRDKIKNKIYKQKTSDPKTFWKIFKKKEVNGNNEKAEFEELVNHFKSVSYRDDLTNSFEKCKDSLKNTDTRHFQNSNILNDPITADEILASINKLKNNKSSGNDNIINEYIKESKNIFLSSYVELFNNILADGIYPSAWCTSIIVPIFKNKGDPTAATNYRPISLTSCLSKLFSSVLNERLKLYLLTENIIKDNQGAFMPGTSTTNHVFNLNCLLENAKNTKSNLFCAFLDLSAAYDNIWREGLFFKLVNNGINGPFLKLIKNMYENTKAYVRYNDTISNTFDCNIGIKQGCSLSCLLFAIYLNDLEDHLKVNECSGFNVSCDSTTSMLKLLLLLYADDTVIISDTPKGLNKSLHAFHEYCEAWGLKINNEKSKVLIFGKDRKNYKFSINEETIEKVKTFKYLGTLFTSNCRYNETIKYNIKQASRAAFSISKRSRELNLSPSCELHILNTVVKPILLYNCEIYSVENTAAIENFYLKCIKRILKVNKSTPSYMVYGETGSPPIRNDIVLRTISFYLKTKHSITNSLPQTLLCSLLSSYDNTNKTSKYLYNVEKMLNELPYGFSNLFYYPLPTGMTIKQAIKCVKQSIHTQYLHMYKYNLDNSKRLFYRSIKEEFIFEPYLDILPTNLRVPLTKFRLSNHKLPIEKGRWSNVPRSDRICPNCNDNIIGDEHHYLFECPTVEDARLNNIKSYYYKNPSVYKSQSLFSARNKRTLLGLAKLVLVIMKNNV